MHRFFCLAISLAWALILNWLSWALKVHMQILNSQTLLLDRKIDALQKLCLAYFIYVTCHMIIELLVIYV